MDPSQRELIHIDDGIHADIRTRDASFVMKGHHCHACCELYYTESGSCRFLIDESIYDLHAGDFILIPPMTLHYTRYVSGACRRDIVFFRPEDVPENIRGVMPGGERFFSETSVFQVPEAFRGRVTECFRQISAEETLQDSRSPILLSLYLQILLTGCSRVCRFPAELPADIHTTDQQILKAAYYINEHYMQPLATQDVARAVSFSPNHLSRKFRQVTGIGLHEYLVFIRLHHAAQELVATEDSITTIALRCGFSDSNYFKDSFKKKYGVTPRKYRQIK